MKNKLIVTVPPNIDEIVVKSINEFRFNNERSSNDTFFLERKNDFEGKWVQLKKDKDWIVYVDKVISVIKDTIEFSGFGRIYTEKKLFLTSWEVVDSLTFKTDNVKIVNREEIRAYLFNEVKDRYEEGELLQFNEGTKFNMKYEDLYFDNNTIYCGEYNNIPKIVFKEGIWVKKLPGTWYYKVLYENDCGEYQVTNHYYKNLEEYTKDIPGLIPISLIKELKIMK